LYEPAAAEQGVTIHVEEKGDALVAALDRALVQRALSNLVTNALTHTRAEGHVRLSATGADGTLTITVVGIPSEHLARVVDRFYRVDASRSLASGGLGLGLAIVQSIVKVHGGSMELTSQEGHGTTARLSFPAALLESGSAQVARLAV
jgi:two-component system, OmpR family, heavy metal sensor histidine kinase CusS